MKIGEKCSFWDIYKTYGIRIPQIQRDYVQGRKNPLVEKNRVSFVKELVAALVDNKPIFLNFIYGYYEDDRFIPIDGQQRLTTLFLLHYIVFSKCGRTKDLSVNGKIRFSYETRYTTDRFLKALCDPINAESKSDGKLGNSIKNEHWYSFSWNSDPSVESCLTMLNEIDSAMHSYADWKLYYKRLTSESCPIRFMLLEMERDQLGKPNQLYIRMNSRGKQLTDFENFKASLYGYIEESGSTALQKQKKALSTNMDGSWQELVWSVFSNDQKAEKYADTLYRDLLHWSFINTACINDIFLDRDNDWIRPDGKNVSNVYFEKYPELVRKRFKELKLESEQKEKKVQCILLEYLEDVISVFSILLSIISNLSLWNRIKKEVLGYSESKGIYNFDISSYKERILLYAVTVFGRRFPDFKMAAFQAWFRVVLNLVNNSPIDDPNAFKNACRAVNDFNGNLSGWLQNETTAAGFRPRQIFEERFKLSVMETDDGWKDAILKAEENEYYQGEILFSFYLIDICSKQEAVSEKIEEFNLMWTVINKVTAFARSNDVLFHRALLTYGDYSVPAPGSAGRYGVHTFFQSTERHHDYDWRGMLRPKGKDGKLELSEGAKIFRDFLKDCLFKAPESVANTALKAYKKQDGGRDSLWEEVRYDLIKTDGMFRYCSAYYYIWHDADDVWQHSDGWAEARGTNWNRYCLMRTSKFGRNSYMEARAYALWLNSTEAKKEYREGSSPWQLDNDERRSWVVINGIQYELRKDIFPPVNNIDT